jgi:hypothetical protein
MQGNHGYNNQYWLTGDGSNAGQGLLGGFDDSTSNETQNSFNTNSRQNLPGGSNRRNSGQVLGPYLAGPSLGPVYIPAAYAPAGNALTGAVSLSASSNSDFQSQREHREGYTDSLSSDVDMFGEDVRNSTNHLQM